MNKDDCQGCILYHYKDCRIQLNQFECPCQFCICKVTCSTLASACTQYRNTLDKVYKAEGERMNE